ncbi:MAG TPA: outer membrane beta-barrel protein [Bryobacteraceae bacterium]|jgi:outer membrane protein W
MKFVRLLVVCSAAATLPAAMAQKWEFGMGAGGGFYTSQDVTLGSDSAAAKFKTNVAVSTWVGNNISERVGGELRYSYQIGDMQLKRNSSEALFGAESHTIDYSFLFYTKPSEAKIRPFVSAGAGMKFYRGTGTESVTQPLSQFALLTKANDLTGVVTVGGGVKMRLGSRAWLRFDVHDYMSPFPKQVITPNVGANVEGWLHDIVPMVAISFGN